MEAIATGQYFVSEERDIGERTAVLVQTVDVSCDMRAEAEDTIEQSACNASERDQMASLQQMKLTRGFCENKERTGEIDCSSASLLWSTSYDVRRLI